MLHIRIYYGFAVDMTMNRDYTDSNKKKNKLCGRF
jgi:hypothetical protein